MLRKNRNQMPPPKAKKHQLSYRMMIRISPGQRVKLRMEARKRGVKESTLGRVWMVEKLGALK